MARIARIVLPGAPHLVTQRGNRGEPVFFEDGDYRLYKQLLAEAAARAGTAVWAYCLMPNHVHLILVPGTADGLRATLADAHRRYTRHINARQGWTGHLWQGRFGSVAMDEDYLIHALRYVSLNPLRAGLVRRARDWKWASTRAHLTGKDDGLVDTAPALKRIPDFKALLRAGEDPEMWARIHKAEGIGRPLGSEDWLKKVEKKLGRRVRPEKRGPKPKADRSRDSKHSRK